MEALVIGGLYLTAVVVGVVKGWDPRVTLASAVGINAALTLVVEVEMLVEQRLRRRRVGESGG